MDKLPEEEMIEQKLIGLRSVPSLRFQHRMQRAPWTPVAAVKRRLAAGTSLALLLIAALLVATPGGRALAAEILGYFRRAVSDALPVQPFQMTPIPATTTPDPGFLFDQALADVEMQAGFTLLQPSWLPVDDQGQALLSFEGASFDSRDGIARTFYRYVLGGDDLTDGLIVRQELYQSNDDCELCGLVGASAMVELVDVNGVTAEYVEGVWKLTETGPLWESDPYLKTMRWRANGMALELSYFGLAVTRQDLITIAESIR